MRNRELLVRKLEKLDGLMTSLQHIVKTQQPIGEYLSKIETSMGLIEELKAYIESEPRSPGEINKL